MPRSQRLLHICAVISLVGLIVLCTTWELVLAPLRPGGSWMAIKALQEAQVRIETLEARLTAEGI